MRIDRPITEDDIQGFIDGRITPDRAALVDTYLIAEPDVARRVSAQKAIRLDLRAALDPYAAEPVPTELNLAHLIAAHRRPRFVSWGSIAACACFLAIGGGGGWVMRSASEAPANGLAALANEASASYKVFASDNIQPVEYRAADKDRLTTWISSRTQRPAKVPDLAKAGYRFMGGRVVATPNGPAGMYMFDDDKGTRIVLLTRPMADSVSGPMTQHKGGSVDGYTWAASGLGYSLVGPDATAGLHPLADEVRRQLGDAV